MTSLDSEEDPVVNVVHIDNPGKFFVRSTKDQKKLDALSKAMSKMELKARKDEKFDALTKALQNMQLHPGTSPPKLGAVKRHGTVQRCTILEYKDKYAEVRALLTQISLFIPPFCVAGPTDGLGRGCGGGQRLCVHVGREVC